ncbi:MAG: neutral/alkaline non-lysosomal ceramidase N-terminal domain-containing protein [Propionicimonas sp.]|uniref:neutral/alkaline non-lysosomal ceramidase N-terminal domain-containing protein n=1 Tax=Propionicimonas sp. TaxID=1955623 RepID=UPI003D1344EE
MTRNQPFPSPLSAGAARVDITPSDLGGLNAFGPDFLGVHDRLHARALVLDVGGDVAALVSLDLVEVGDTSEVRARVERELGIPADRVLLAPSHDHNAPRIGLVPPGGKARIPTPESLAYTRTVYEAIVEVIGRARAAVRPVTMAIGAEAVDVNVCREAWVDGRWTLGYEPDGASDKNLTTVSFTAEDGTVVAVVLNYAVHSTVMLGVRQVSGDLAGAAAAHVEAELGPDTVALWTAGALGDQAPKVQLGTPTDDAAHDEAFAVAAMQAQGFLLGATAVRLVRHAARPVPVRSLAGSLRVIPCPARRLEVPPGMEQADVETVDLTLTCLVVGPVALAGVSGEITVPVARALATASPLATTLVVTNANARIGYLPTDESYLRRTQAADGCPIVQGHAASTIVDGLAGMIEAALS